VNVTGAAIVASSLSEQSEGPLQINRQGAFVLTSAKCVVTKTQTLRNIRRRALEHDAPSFSKRRGGRDIAAAIFAWASEGLLALPVFGQA
jgi:hypothetical protein